MDHRPWLQLRHLVLLSMLALSVHFMCFTKTKAKLTTYRHTDYNSTNHKSVINKRLRSRADLTLLATTTTTHYYYASRLKNRTAQVARADDRSLLGEASEVIGVGMVKRF